ncbi:glycoside hydrolase [Cohnella pontilimi]|uniref:Glycoside hydrolase n=2 Tax=Cohnella pontilimi TaxID=2564100 RepID=A0A4U0FHW3_9BACL|nr:glycoside hydrolase [Cohnella pontilimi]
MMILAIFMATLLIVMFLEYRGIVWHNSLFANKYEVKGLDVSHYQSEVDWSKVTRGHQYQFAYIKATEGSDHIDDYFEKNWTSAKENGLLVGAYHFFTSQSTGEQQARNFIKIVPKEEESLPPVIDIEIDTNKDVQLMRKEIKDMSNLLESHYGKKPILYVTYATYNQYVGDGFSDHEIWIRDVIKPPKLKDQRRWTFWQYNNRGHIAGIDAYVDINVFNGTLEEFNRKFKVGG